MGVVSGLEVLDAGLSGGVGGEGSSWGGVGWSWGMEVRPGVGGRWYRWEAGSFICQQLSLRFCHVLLHWGLVIVVGLSLSL